MERINKSYGGYKKLKSYENATIVYDLTVLFCRRYMTYKTNKSYRTYDQMIQAARSGKQNIVEGSLFSATSKKAEIKLLGVARASLEELLSDYEDFLRQRDFIQWEKDSQEARKVRLLAYKTSRSYRTYMSYMANPQRAANCIICLINQTNFLLDRQITSLENNFIREGGYTEKLFKTRIARK